MKTPLRPVDESQRLEALRRYKLLDTLPEQALDDLTALAAHICAAPISLITLVDEERQWFKSRIGLSFCETPRDISFCGHAILEPGVFIVPDALQDERFADNPLVTGEPHIRFYAGAPLVTPEGQALGTLCVADRVPRQLNVSQQEALRVLSRQVMAQLELRRQTRELTGSEQQLREREEQLRFYAENSPTAVAMFDREMKYLVASRRWLERYGLIGKPIIGRSHYEDLPDFPRRWIEAHRRCLAGAIEKCDEDSAPDISGQIRWARWEARPWHQADGSIGGIIIFTEDITERKLAEEKAASQQNLLDSLIAAIPDLVYFKDRESRFIRINKEYARRAGLPDVNAALGKTDFDIFGEQHARQAYADEQRIIATGEPMIDKEEREDWPDGHVTWASSTKLPMRDGSGKIIGIMGISRDITGRKQTEEALARERNLLRAIFDLLPDYIYLKDEQSRFIMCNNRRAEDNAIPVKASELIGKTDADFFPPEQAAQFRADELVVLGGTPIINKEETLIRPDGTRQVILTTKLPFRDGNGKIIGLLGYGRDITERKLAAEKLAAEQHLLNSLITTTPDRIYFKDRESRFIKINEAFVRMHEFSDPGTLLGKTDFDIFGERHARQAFEDEQRIMATGEPIIDKEEQEDWPDGHVTWASSTKLPLRDGSGKIIGIVGITRNITERKLAEQHIQHLNRVYAVLSDVNQTIVRETNSQTMLEMVCRIAVEKGRFRMAWIGKFDAATQQLEPIAASGVVEGYTDLVKINLRDKTRAIGPAGRCLLTGEHAVCNNIADDPDYAQWRDEALRRGYRSSGGFPLKVKGQVVGVFNLYADEPDFFDADELQLLDELAMDISFALEISRRETDRRKAEDELRWRTAFFEAQVDSALDGILVVDDQGKKILQNRRLNELWKIPPPIAESDDDAAQIEFITGLTKNPQQFVDEIAYLYSHPNMVSRDEIELKDGTVLDRSSFPVRDQTGKYYGRIWTFRDITERKRLEAQFRQSQKMEAIGQLAGGVAHDFNNILAVIMMQVGLAATQANLSAEMQETLEDIKTAAERAANLTRQLLAFSRRQIMQSRQLDLNEIVTSLTKMLQRILGEDVRLQLNLHSRPLMTRADAGMLDQVLLNLVVNARDAMPGGGRLVIETGEKNFTAEEAAMIPDAATGPHVYLRVTDTGHGIAPDHLTRIFEPFFTTKEPGKGTGLGLATVFGIVKQHLGFVTVESEVKRGTTFQIFLRAEEVTDQSRAEEAARPLPRGGTETILLVEDEPAVRMLTRVVLERAGYRILEAANGVEALKIWEQHKDAIQLLFSDIVMPEGISGRELATRLQAQSPKLPVIFTSGYSADIAGRELTLQTGQNFIQKPSLPRQLLETVRHCLDG